MHHTSCTHTHTHTHTHTVPPSVQSGSYFVSPVLCWDRAWWPQPMAMWLQPGEHWKHSWTVLGTVYPVDNVYTYVLVNLEAIPTLGSDIHTWNILPPPISLPGYPILVLQSVPPLTSHPHPTFLPPLSLPSFTQHPSPLTSTPSPHLLYWHWFTEVY